MTFGLKNATSTLLLAKYFSIPNDLVFIDNIILILPQFMIIYFQKSSEIPSKFHTLKFNTFEIFQYPKTQEKVTNFIELVRYYHHFIFNFVKSRNLSIKGRIVFIQLRQ